jgi:formamidopyrimidine-DNA glycosylase
MPELPDVELFKRYFDATALHQPIQEVEVYPEQILGGVTGRELKLRLAGQTFSATHRHGKYLFASLDGNECWLVFHFGMTGYLKYFKKSTKKPLFDRMLISFENGYRLAYVSKRKLGRIEPAGQPAWFIRHKGLGPDALSPDLDADGFREIISSRDAMIKSVLTDQSAVAGIGNVYADEILFHAGIRPKKKASKLSGGLVDRVFDQMREVLRIAIDCRAEPDRMPDYFLTPRRDIDDAACPICGETIRKTRIADRPTRYCPTCQV